MKRTLLIVITCVVAVAAFYYLGRQVDWQAIRALSARDVTLLSLSSVLMVAAHAAGATALLAALHYHASVGKVMAAMLAASIVGLAGDPKLGLPARLYFYKALAQIPVTIGVTQILAESALWLFIMALIVAIPGAYDSAYAQALSHATMAALLVGLALFIAAPALAKRFWLLRHLFSDSTRVGRFVLSVRTAFVSMHKGQVLHASAWFIVTYIIDAATLWYILHLSGYSIDAIILAHAIVISYLAGAVSLLPLGLGVRDVALAVLLTQTGVSESHAAGAALILRTIRTSVPLAMGGVIALFILPSSWKHKTETRDSRSKSH
jgi:uncharacterized protein (TIRG00374 family)